MRIIYLKYLCLLILFLNLSISYSQTDNQKPLSENPTQFRKYVVDETSTLTQDQINNLLKKLQDEERTTTNQIIVYMIPSLNGESLEDVSIRLAEKNKIGKKDRNNGVLMLVVKDDRKIRIEVGYGLEGVLTDAVSSKIMRNDITPSFKAGNFYEGINKGVDAIIATIKGEYTADKSSKDTQNSNSNSTCCFGMPIFIIIIFGFIFISIIGSLLRRIFGVGRTLYSGRRGWGGGGFGGFGGFGGGGSSGGGGGFGGFSGGGGGSFGGGGASGSW